MSRISIAPEDPESDVAEVLDRARAASAGSTHCLVLQYKPGDNLFFNSNDVPLPVLALMQALVGKLVLERLGHVD